MSNTDTASSQMVSIMLTQDEWVDLLNALPDAFYRLDVRHKDLAWRRIASVASWGERDVKKLSQAGMEATR